jgi:hypothetical protein
VRDQRSLESGGRRIGHVSIQICSLLAPCQRPVLIATKYLLIQGIGHYLVELTGISEPLPTAEPRRGRRTVLIFPLLPPPQKN